MATSSILGGDAPPQRAEGRDADLLGPSDNSDSGSDTVGTHEASDAQGTGERASATDDEGRDGADILPDQVRGDPTFSSQEDPDEGLSAEDLAETDIEDLIADEEAGIDRDDEAVDTTQDSR